MGIDLHAFNFLRLQAQNAPLGHVLTVGRQSLGLPPKVLEATLGPGARGDGYCEPLLRAMTASQVDSIDFSDYEDATFVADFNQPVQIGQQFDTIVDSGSLEHIFDVAMAFRNVAALCKVGGRIIHVLPVNNLNGHGFWQFSSDLLHSVYSERNGFGDTEVFYASSLDFSTWYKAPRPRPGTRVQVVSVEPLILLSVTRKTDDCPQLTAVQPFYEQAWRDHAPEALYGATPGRGLAQTVKSMLRNHGDAAKVLRNIALLAGLASGRSRYSIKHPTFQRIAVDAAVGGYVQ